MALSPTSRDTSYRDPYELDRLADELASRELTSPTRDSHQLPEYEPLTHDNKYLTAPVFNVEEFLLARSHIQLPELRSELRQYLAQLKEELVKLLNDDYEDFISLSTDLRDEGARMERVKHPLASLKVQTEESKQELLAIQRAIHEKLEKRRVLREEKALLHLLLKISESVGRLESLLHIVSPDDNGADDGEMEKSKFITFTGQVDAPGESFLTNRAKHLGRVASEYTQLLYHVSKAQEAQCRFVSEIQWRVDRVHSTLSSDLDQLFSQVVVSLIDPNGEGRSTELDRTKWVADLTECLRTYDNLGLWQDAEDILRREVMRVFIKKTIYPGALVAPHSPIIPHTPFHVAASEPMTALGPQIPYTPFTAFISKHQLPRLGDQSSDLPQAQLLNDKDDSLASLYNQILRFVEKDLVRVLDIAEKVSVKPDDAGKGGGASSPAGEDDNAKGFHILSNVIWAEVGRAIMDEIGNVVFAAGRPNEFRKHYETTQGFLRSLESLAPSLQEVEAMRRHPVWQNFERRWQLPVYFQLRWKEVVVSLEDVLSTGKSESNPSKEKGAFKTLQAAKTWVALSSCWSSDVYIPELGYRFWKLSLQLLGRYYRWLHDYLAALDAPSSSTGQGADASNATRGSTAPAPDIQSAESSALDDQLLQEYAGAILDVQMMQSNVLNLWRQVIYVLLPDVEDEDVDLEAALRQSLQPLTALVQPLSNKIIGILTKRCCEPLNGIRNIPPQLRHMANKRTPTEPSYFVPLVLRPLKNFFAIGTAEGPGYPLKEAFLKQYATEVINHVIQRYIAQLTAMKKQKQSLKRLKKTPFALFGGSGTDEDRDEERIRDQMVMDIEAFAKDAKTVQVDVPTNESWSILKDLAHSTGDDASVP